MLTEFGRAFGRLGPDNTGATRNGFSIRRLGVLSQDGRVICVRLALFVEMVKGKPWTAAALKGVGGTEGVGVAFLEGTFSASVATAEHRYHQKAARAVLRACCPNRARTSRGTCGRIPSCWMRRVMGTCERL